MSKLTAEQIAEFERFLEEERKEPHLRENPVALRLLSALKAERAEKEALYGNVMDCFPAVEAGVLNEIPNKGVIAGTHEDHENRGFVTGFLRYGHLVRLQLMKLARTSEAPIIESVYLSVHG